MRLLVTGGAGFIGSNFIRYWLDRYPQDTILNFDLLTYAGDLATIADVERRHADRYAFVKGDIADARAVREALDGWPSDVVVNFAAESHNSRAVVDPTRFTRTNALGTHVLLEAAREARVARFHHISTCEVYGDLPLEHATPFTESSPYLPRTPYNASKAAADLLVRASFSTWRMPVSISNCANNYGPWQHPEKVIPLFTTNAIEDLPLPLYKHSQNRREWLHVDDHCRAIDLIVRKGQIGGTYNVGSGEERTIEELADTVLATLNKPHGLKTYVEDRPGHDRRYLLDRSKVERELGWRPTIRFADGIAATVQWYREHRSWWAPKKERLTYELDETRWARTATVTRDIPQGS